MKEVSGKRTSVGMAGRIVVATLSRDQPDPFGERAGDGAARSPDCARILQVGTPVSLGVCREQQNFAGQDRGLARGSRFAPSHKPLRTQGLQEVANPPHRLPDSFTAPTRDGCRARSPGCGPLRGRSRGATVRDLGGLRARRLCRRRSRRLVPPRSARSGARARRPAGCPPCCGHGAGTPRLRRWRRCRRA